jgi:NADPH2:quinone reductase
MLAAWYKKNGDAKDVLTVSEVSTPEPGPGEVRVHIKASGVNPSDTKARAARPVPQPYCIPHSDGAGVIDAVGAGVDASRIGQRVWIWNGQWQRPFGTAAQYIALPAEQAVPLPDNTSFEAGACLGIPALTAARAVELLGDIQGKTIVIIGAGSAVGHYATQLAILQGATVIGTGSSADKIAHAMQAGATHMVNYKTENVAERVKELTNGRGADGIIDMDFSTTAAMLGQGIVAHHSPVVIYGSNTLNDDVPVPIRAVFFASLTLHTFLLYELQPQVRERNIAWLNKLMSEGKLQHAISQCYNLKDAAAAHEMVESGRAVGNVVIQVE